MTELDALRRAFEVVPEPGEAAYAAAREGLLADIAGSRSVAAPRQSRRWLRLTAAVAVGIAAVLLGAFALVIPRGKTLTGTEIAAAAAGALTPPPGMILHEVQRFTWAPIGDTDQHPAVTERWVAGGRPYVVYERSPDLEWESGECGEIRYDRRSNLLNTSAFPDHPSVRESLPNWSDPAREYLDAYRSGHVRSRGKTTYRGIPAYTLVLSFPSYPLVVTYVVRRDNYYPLTTVRRTKTHVGVFTYSAFEQIPRTTRTEHLLHMGPHPGAFILGRGFYRPRRACIGFGSYESLTGKGKNP